VIEMIGKYDNKVFLPFFMVTFWLLNFGSVHGPIEEVNPSQKSSIFGAMASNEAWLVAK
jgi:hypothetical protein